MAAIAAEMAALARRQKAIMEEKKQASEDMKVYGSMLNPNSKISKIMSNPATAAAWDAVPDTLKYEVLRKSTGPAFGGKHRKSHKKRKSSKKTYRKRR